ncbi:MAG: T9SS type A sorting domain-containing protein [Bacteroidetes bacterium]|nr:T9SS type A sorting domain-containing protein [Bacteroidota bacterium]
MLIIITGTQTLSQTLPWNAFFGNEGAEFAYDIKQTTDHGYIIAAYANNGGSSDFYVVKLNTWGGLEWEKIISKDDNSDRAFSVVESQEGDFIIIGNATNFNKPWLVKINPLGDTLWTSQWTDSVANNTGLLARGTLLPDGRIVVVSHEDAYALDPYMFIVSEDGELLEERDLTSLVPLGWYSGTVINDIESTNDGGFILTGATGGGTGSRAYLWKFDANADSSWSKIYDANGVWMRSAQSVKQLSDGGYVLTGFTAPNATTTAAIRADEQGNLLWYQSYADSIYTNGTDIIEWKSGEFLITEKRFSGFGTSFFKSALLRIDSLGNLLSRDPIMASDSSTTITQMRQTSDGGFVMAGEINEYLSVGEQDLFVLKSDSLGNIDNVFIDYVWPGDVNYDGEVSMADLMILGVTAGTTGPARTDKSLGWYPHYVTDWSDTVVSGVNYKHADGDGNGVIDMLDTLAISLNYGNTHVIPSKSSMAYIGAELWIDPAEITLDDNHFMHIPLYLGDASNSIEDLYGFRFDVQTAEPFILLDQSKYTLEGEWLTAEQGIFTDLVYITENDDWMSYGFTKMDHEQVTGYGLVGKLWIKLDEELIIPGEEISFDLTLANAAYNNYFLDQFGLNTSTYNIILNNTMTGIADDSADFIHIYPNPLEGNVFRIDAKDVITDLKLHSIDGKVLDLSDQVKQNIIQIPDGLKPGIYFIQIETRETKTATKKLIIR